MWARFQNMAGQPTQHAARPHLNEGAHARGVHGLDLLNEADRLGKLMGQQIAHGLGLARIGCCAGVGENWDRRCRQRHAPQELAQWLRGRADQMRVESSRDFEPRRRHGFFSQAPLCLRDSFRGAREHELLGAIVVGHHQVELPLVEQGLHVLASRRH